MAEKMEWKTTPFQDNNHLTTEEPSHEVKGVIINQSNFRTILNYKKLSFKFWLNITVDSIGVDNFFYAGSIDLEELKPFF